MTQNTLAPDYIPNKTLAFIDQHVYCDDHYKRVMTMWLHVLPVKNALSAIAYILATSDKPESGKSTIAFDIPMLLGHLMESIDKTTTQPGMNALFLVRDTPNTAWDDIGKIFGNSGNNGSTSPFYTQLVRSYKKNATTLMARAGGQKRVSTYGGAALNGLEEAVPLDLFTRCIHFKMTKAPECVELRDTGDDSSVADAELLKEAIVGWAGAHVDEIKLFIKNKIRTVHPKLVGRRRQKWMSLFAAAASAGGEWPRWMMEAFIAIELGASEKPKLLPEQFLTLDTADWFAKSGQQKVFVSDLIEVLRLVPNGQYYRDVDDEHLIRLFKEVFGPPKRISAVKLYGEFEGERGKANGYDDLPIMKAALELRDGLYPPMEGVRDELEDDLSFTPAVK
jgi:hypothetical protein